MDVIELQRLIGQKVATVLKTSVNAENLLILLLYIFFRIQSEFNIQSDNFYFIYW